MVALALTIAGVQIAEAQGPAVAQEPDLPLFVVENLCEYSISLSEIETSDGGENWKPVKRMTEWTVQPGEANYLNIPESDDQKVRGKKIRFKVTSPDGVSIPVQVNHAETEELWWKITGNSFAEERPRADAGPSPDLRSYFRLYDLSKKMELATLDDITKGRAALDEFTVALKRISRDDLSDDMDRYIDEMLDFAEKIDRRATESEGLAGFLTHQSWKLARSQALFATQKKLRERLEAEHEWKLPFVSPTPVGGIATSKFLFSEGYFVLVEFGGLANLGETSLIYSDGGGNRKTQETVYLSNDPSKLGWKIERGQYVIVKTDLGVSIYETSWLLD